MQTDNMRYRLMRHFGLFYISICVFVSLFGRAAAAQNDLEALLAKFPAQSPEEQANLSAGLLALGPQTIEAVCAKLVPSGGGDDNAARYALSGLAKHVMRPSAEAERSVFTGALLNALGVVQPDEVKAFLIEQLGLTGGPECVGGLATRLGNETLCDHAARALTVIGTAEAKTALLAALDKVPEKCRPYLISALGTLRYAPAVPALTTRAAGGTPVEQGLALRALAAIGAPESLPIFDQFLAATPTPEQAEAILDYAEAVSGSDAATAERLRHALLDKSDLRTDLRIAALLELAAAAGEQALPDLMRAAQNEDLAFRQAALRLAGETLKRSQVGDWLACIESAPAAAKPDILDMLARSGGREVRPMLLKALADPDPAMRAVAIRAVPNFSDSRSLNGLLDLLARSEDNKDEREAVAAALLRFAVQKAGEEVAARIPDAAPNVKKALLEWCAAKSAQEQAEAVFTCLEDADEGVRRAAQKALAQVARMEDVDRLIGLLLAAADEKEITAMQNALTAALNQRDEAERAAPVLSALASVTGEARARLLRVLPFVGNEASLDAVLADLPSQDPAVRAGALDALAAWPALPALEPILAALPGVTEARQQEALARGYARIVRDSKRSEGKQLQFLADLMNAAASPDLKRVVMQEVAQYRTVGALRIIAPLLDDPAIQKEAAKTIATLACPQKDGDPGLRAHAVARLLEKALPFLDDDALKAKAQAHIGAMPQPDGDGFVSLFNGTDLSGWTGDLASYAAEEGALVCKEKAKGNLYSDMDYGNFAFRFEFLLTPGANNGVGIRVPLYGHAAYDGMEVQVIDDTAPEYADLKPYQYHGSIYGLVAAEVGHLKPVGEWNEEEITAQGTRITVRLNGAVIVDADIAQFKNAATPDDKAHPGLFNETGRIAFLGHGALVKFRNIRLKELE